MSLTAAMILIALINGAMLGWHLDSSSPFGAIEHRRWTWILTIGILVPILVLVINAPW